MANTGIRNTGDYNSGDRNSGDCNSGDRNSGNCNSGDYNSGGYNSGDCNSGHHNSGNCNSGDYNSGHFNTDEPTVRMFNKDTGKLHKDITIPYIYLPLTEWVPFVQGTSPEDAEVTQGHLITRTYKEAWALAWGKASEDIKSSFKNLPNFCPDIFLEITGIDVRTEGNLKVRANGKIVYISRESAVALGLLEAGE